MLDFCANCWKLFLCFLLSCKHLTTCSIPMLGYGWNMTESHVHEPQSNGWKQCPLCVSGHIEMAWFSLVVTDNVYAVLFRRQSWMCVMVNTLSYPSLFHMWTVLKFSVISLSPHVRCVNCIFSATVFLFILAWISVRMQSRLLIHTGLENLYLCIQASIHADKLISPWLSKPPWFIHVHWRKKVGDHNSIYAKIHLGNI